MKTRPLTPEVLDKMDAYWRSANWPERLERHGFRRAVLTVLNALDRVHLVMDAVDRHGEGMRAIRNWE